jgi:gamma-glutamyl-gamma-aminobutyrate hydrolase PuuD
LKKVNTNTFYGCINLQKNIINTMIAVIECPGNSPKNYMTWLESGGLIPVRIPYTIPKDELLLCLQRVEGVLWTGGAIEKAKYDAVRPIYLDTLRTTFEVAKRYNDKGLPYPLWGICQGLEFLALFQEGKHDLSSLPKHPGKGNFPITFTGTSDMRKWFAPLEEDMRRKPCAVQHHTYGVDPTMKTLSIQDGYVNILKYKDYPFYGLMFHVERPFDAFSEKVSIHFALFLKSLL